LFRLQRCTPPAAAVYHKVTFHQLLPRTKANIEIEQGMMNVEGEQGNQSWEAVA